MTSSWLAKFKMQNVLYTSSMRKRVHHKPRKNALACALARRAYISATLKLTRRLPNLLDLH